MVVGVHDVDDLLIALLAENGGKGVQRGGALRLGEFAEPEPIARHHRHRQVGPRRFLGAVELEERLAALLAIERLQKCVCLRHGIGDNLIAAPQVAREIHSESKQHEAS